MENVLRGRSLPTDMAELSLLLPGWQMRELADLAAARRMTVGQLMREVIQQMLQQFDADADFPNNSDN